MKKLILCLILPLLAQCEAVSQNQETRNLDSFNKVSISEAIEVILKHGNKEEAIVEARNSVLDRVVTEISGATLYIKMRNGRYNSGPVKVYLTYKNLEALNVNSAAEVRCDGVLSNDQFSIDVNSAAQADLELNVNKLEVDVNSAGKLELSGSCNFVEVDVDSAGKLYAFDLKSENAEVSVDSGGKAEIFVTKELLGHADSGGGLYYKGEPDRIKVDSDSGGRVRKAD